ERPPAQGAARRVPSLVVTRWRAPRVFPRRRARGTLLDGHSHGRAALAGRNARGQWLPRAGLAPRRAVGGDREAGAHGREPGSGPARARTDRQRLGRNRVQVAVLRPTTARSRRDAVGGLV